MCASIGRTHTHMYCISYIFLSLSHRVVTVTLDPLGLLVFQDLLE